MTSKSQVSGAHPINDQAPDASFDVAEHITEARARAREMLAGESHLAAIDDWRRALTSARDALVLIWLVWLAMQGFGAQYSGYLLAALSVALALLVGISTARSTYTQVQYYAAELERERSEIRNNFEEEREEVRVLYAAKGFTEPLLGQIVDTLSSDDDRLLKVMMEEELGLSMYHVNHPLVVGLWNFLGAALAGLALSLPIAWSAPGFAHLWVPVGGSALMMIVAIVAGMTTRRTTIEFFAVGIVMAAVTGGVVYFLAEWFAGFAGASAPS